MFNKAIAALSEKEVKETPKTSEVPVQGTSLSEREFEQDFSESEPEGREEVMLSPVPAKPVDVKVWTSQIKNPA